jgi:hypothetical protein
MAVGQVSECGKEVTKLLTPNTCDIGEMATFHDMGK